jgi:TatD DNase family protein
MTSTHASKKYLDDIPISLKSLHLPESTKPERFVHGQPVKGRNEPSAIGAVAWVIHGLNNIPLEKLTEKAWRNTVEVFRLDELLNDY